MANCLKLSLFLIQILLSPFCEPHPFAGQLLHKSCSHGGVWFWYKRGRLEEKEDGVHFEDWKNERETKGDLALKAKTLLSQPRLHLLTGLEIFSDRHGDLQAHGSR